MASPLLKVENLSIAFPKDGAVNTVVQNLSFSINPGQTLGIVGESGSGKSMTSLAIMGLLPVSAQVPDGTIDLQLPDQTAINLLALKQSQLRQYRGKSMGMIFQEPMSSLNPVHRCGKQVAEVLRLHKGMNKAEAREETIRWFQQVELPRPEKIFDQYPHQLSGGQKQRVMIAMAMCCQPKLLIADEPTTALDVTVQRNILALIRRLQAEQGMAVIFISHDLGVIAEMADEVLVMYAGKKVEQGSISQIFSEPKEPYTKGLLACRPNLNQRLQRLPVLEDFTKTDEPPTLENFPPIDPKSHQLRQETLRSKPPLLKVEGLSTWFPKETSWYGKVTEWVKAVDEVSTDIYPGETLGLVGESGSGKTTFGRSILRLVPIRQGSIAYEGTRLDELNEAQMRPFRKDLQIIFQDPFSSLNPRMTIGQAIQEPMTIHGLGANEKERQERVIALLEKVQLLPEHYDRFPHQFSGGQRQRIGIARALAVEPRLIVCDESVSALDVSVQASILNLLKELQQEMGLTYLFISHDLSVVRFMSDRIMVMQNGQVVEQGDAEDLYANPAQAYTRELLEAVPPATLEEARARREATRSVKQ